MSEAAAPAETTQATVDPIEGLGGSVDDVLEALGLPPEAEGEHDGSAPAGSQPFAEKKPAAEAKGDAEEGAEGAKDEKKAAESDDADLAELKAIRQRAAERKRAARSAQPTHAAKPEETKPAVEARPVEKPAEAKPADVPKPLNAEERDVAKVMRDVLAEIAKLNAEDDAAVAAPEAKDQAAKDAATRAAAERSADLKKLRETVETLSKKLDDSETLKAKYGELEAKIQEMTARREIESKIDRTLGAHADKFPTLMGRRDAVSRVYAAAEKFYQKTGVLPDFRFTAERLERVLSRRETQQNGEGREKTPAPKAGKETSKGAPRKTVSSSLETPPSFRQSPDKRTKQQVEDDLFASLGLDKD